MCGEISDSEFLASLSFFSITRAYGGRVRLTCRATTTSSNNEALCITYDHQYFGGKWTFGIQGGRARLWDPKMEVMWEFCADVTQQVGSGR